MSEVHESQPIEVIVPDQPPILTPRAARALLELILESKERREKKVDAQEPTSAS